MPQVPDDWNALLSELQQRKHTAKAMGGDAKLEKRRAKGQLNARELIRELTDKNSFVELGTLVGSLSYADLPPAPCDALVGGIASIEQRKVIIAVEDFTVQGGSIGHGTNAKRLRLAKLALQEQIPYILILDGAGARMTNGLERHPYAPSDLQVLAQLSGQVPTVALVIGSSAGHGALSGLMMDFVVMLQNSTMFSAGPPLVAAALGEIVSKEDLGSATMHCSHSGVAHNIANDEQQACRLIKQYLSYLPNHAQAKLPVTNKPEDSFRILDEIFHLVPRNGQQPYDVKAVINAVFDQDSFLEIQPLYGKAIVTGLARLNGCPVAVVANQPMVMAGAIDAPAATKAAQFIDCYRSFNLPFVFLADNPGIMSGSKAEQAGTLRAAAAMYKAQAGIQSCKLHVTLRKAYGFGSSLMAMNPFDEQTLTLAFPGISLGGIPVLGGAAASGIDSEQQQALAEQEAAAAWATADNMAFDEIIDPRELRNYFIRGLELYLNRR